MENDVEQFKTKCRKSTLSEELWKEDMRTNQATKITRNHNHNRNNNNNDQIVT